MNHFKLLRLIWYCYAASLYDYVYHYFSINPGHINLPKQKYN